MHTSLYLNLQRLMDREGINQSELSVRCGIPAPTIGRILNQKIIHPGIDSCITLSDYFGVSVDQLVGREPIPGLDLMQNATFSLPYPKTLGLTQFIRTLSAADQAELLDTKLLSALDAIVCHLSEKPPESKK